MKNVTKEADIYRIKGFGLVVIWNNGFSSDPSWFATPLKFYEDVDLKYRKAIVSELDTKADVFDMLVE